jgi:4-hydroxybenzoate polyprenyltransferase
MAGPGIAATSSSKINPSPEHFLSSGSFMTHIPDRPEARAASVMSVTARPPRDFLAQLKPYAQLVRLPNVFTAFADICLGGLAAHILPDRWLPFLFLLLSSGCLYCAGMVWNDFFDIDQDRKERPFRPIPSGRVPRERAGRLGAGLLLMGVGLATLAGVSASAWNWVPVALALALVAAILLYDAWLKRTWAGPLGMGACRFLNVLLGVSVAADGAAPWSVHAAAVVGLYIVGVTWFARTEARASKQSTLAAAALVMLAALLLALPLPLWLQPPEASSPLFPYLLVALGLLVGIPAGEAVAHPAPAQVQAAVKRAIMGLVLLDAVLATALAGAIGLVILLLLLPALYLGRWIYST